MASAELRNVAIDAASYFSDIRVPATFLAGSAVGGLFTMKSNQQQLKTMPRVEYWVRIVYTFLMFTTFLLSMNTAIMASSAFLTTKNTAVYNPMATSAFELLVREFNYELTITRWSYEISMISFIVAIMLRLLLEFDAFDKAAPRRRKSFAAAILLFTSSLAAHLMSFINTRMYQFKSIGALTIEVVKLVAGKNLKGHPLAALSVICAVMGALLLGRGLAMPPV
eukprot:CAMPEP_0198142052 /NCGR_PEP_ID=MMETSP1443-20131203/4956_1 /TAXON_ID=186043 /ORGANISM="Entomoneis sp., Strain CCMP2396" /LENGTH=223 /DNA_ID=CAMNT_0043804989 /DNA_START=131 /DNA_END=802 /DNA_ORIENTATION=+